MRRFLWAFWKVDLALTLAVVIALAVVWKPNPTVNRPADNTAAQTNLGTALTGAASFYDSNQDSYLGIDGSPDLAAGVSSIAQIDAGFTFVSGRTASSGPNVISIFAPSRSVVVMTAYSKGIRVCWGILSVTRSLARSYFLVFLNTANLGTFYFRGTSSASSDCAAARIVPTALKTSGFPAA